MLTRVVPIADKRIPCDGPQVVAEGAAHLQRFLPRRTTFHSVQLGSALRARSSARRDPSEVRFNSFSNFSEDPFAAENFSSKPSKVPAWGFPVDEPSSNSAARDAMRLSRGLPVGVRGKSGSGQTSHRCSALVFGKRSISVLNCAARSLLRGLRARCSSALRPMARRYPGVGRQSRRNRARRVVCAAHASTSSG